MSKTLRAERPNNNMLQSDYFLYRLAEQARQELPIDEGDALVMGLWECRPGLWSIEFDNYGPVYFRFY